MCFFHKWTKWQDIGRTDICKGCHITGDMFLKTRTCEKCDGVSNKPFSKPVGAPVLGQHYDPHRKTAAEHFGVAYEDVTPEQRKVGKTLNYLRCFSTHVFLKMGLSYAYHSSQ